MTKFVGGATASASILLLTACGHSRLTALKPPALDTVYQKQIRNAVDAGDGDYELRALRARLDANPSSLAARLELAARYRKLGFTEVAIEHGRLACERNPDSDDAHTALAKMLRAAERTSEAASVLSTYTASHTEAGPDVWAWLGLLRDETGDWKAGEAAYRKALALAPARDEFHNNLGYCLLQQGRRDEAAGEFRLALQLHPHSAIAENNLAMALAGRGETGDAVAHLQSVADPATAHNNLAVAMLEAGRFKEARREIDAALRYNRAHSAALNNLRLLSELDGQPLEIRPLGGKRGSARSGTQWSRLLASWRRFWGTGTPDEQKRNDAGSAVASR